jgi:uncharacterized protein
LSETFRAVLVVGPRACGKTTTSKRIAASTSRLDEPSTAAVFRADPDAALAVRASPILLDEWQDVPEVLGAVKRAVDTPDNQQRFILTGSVSAAHTTASWPGTGRLIRLPMRGLCQFELSAPNNPSEIGSTPTPLRELVSFQPHRSAQVPLSVNDYVDRALRGGFPDAVACEDDRDRRLWFDSYIEQLVSRDVARLGSTRDAASLRRYLQVLALNSAGLVDDTTIFGAAGIDRRTHLVYEKLLEDIFVLDVVPAWSTNRLKRLVKSPKRYLVDSGLMAAAARIGIQDIRTDGNLLGRVLYSFVYNELRTLSQYDPDHPTIHHIRTAEGRQEIDLLLEFDGGRVMGIEVKATSAPSKDSARHLFWLHRELGDAFVGGVVFHTGPEAIRFSESIVALPISTLWARSS